MTTFVLVHGAAHGGWCYGPVARLLRDKGHDVLTPTLTGTGERSHLIDRSVDLDTHITDVVNVLVYEDLRDVVLVGHSYAGMVITGVADRALDRIGHLVFLDAAQPRNGEALVDLVAGLEHLKDAGTMVDGVQLILTPDNGHTYGVTDPDTCAWMLQRLTPHPWRTFSQPLVLEHEAEVLGLPSTAITCPDTLERQPTQNNIARANAADNVWHLDGGHDLMLVDPEGVVELLLRLAV